jgi:hypothetical protein
MQDSRLRNLQFPINPDEPMRKADISSGNRIYKNASISGAVTVDWSLYDEVRFTIVGNTTLSFIGATDGQGCIVKIKQDGVGNHTVAFPSNIRHSIDMRSYSVSAAPGAVDRVGFMYDLDDLKYDFISAVRNLA